MPLQIDEVLITVQVGERAGSGSVSTSIDDEAKKRIIEECVEHVLEILKQQKEP